MLPGFVATIRGMSEKNTTSAAVSAVTDGPQVGFDGAGVSERKQSSQASVPKRARRKGRSRTETRDSDTNFGASGLNSLFGQIWTQIIIVVLAVVLSAAATTFWTQRNSTLAAVQSNTKDIGELKLAMVEISSSLEALSTKLDDTNTMLDDMGADLDARFAAIHAKLDAQQADSDARFDAIHAKLDAQQADSDARFDAIHAGLLEVATLFATSQSQD